MNETLAKAMIAAALITRGHFDLTQYDERGRLREPGTVMPNPAHALDELAAAWVKVDAGGGPHPALDALRTMTDIIYRTVSRPASSR
jgi:hypothetical protein